MYFIKSSLYAAALCIALFVVLSTLSCIDIVQQLHKVTIALLTISLIGGIFGSYITSEYRPE
jgi:tryptophan-rich sensory protein